MSKRGCANWRGVADATFLACAGLNCLGFADKMTAAVPVEVMLPAIAQGAIGIEIREDDEATRKLLSAINHRQSEIAVTCERAFLKALDGSCRSPLAGLATLASNVVSFRGHALTPDGVHCFETTRTGSGKRCGKNGRRCRQGSEGSWRRTDRILMRLIITRPEEDALPLKAKLETRGHAAIMAPLLKIVPRSQAFVPPLAYQLVCITSANALRFLPG